MDISKEEGNKKGENKEEPKTETKQYEEVTKILKDLGITKAIKGAVEKGAEEKPRRLPRMTKFERNVNAVIKLIPWLILLIGSIYSLHLIFRIIWMVMFGI